MSLVCALDGDVRARLEEATSLGGGTLPGDVGNMPGEGVNPGVGDDARSENADRCGVPTIERGMSFGGEESGCDEDDDDDDGNAFVGSF